ncbi:MAG: dTDP-4-dehydrorhamnose 3,5-epimerase [Snodgrassella sp.]|uniref:dTDP-4-dehydrorhamnose 3,5-epimerase n=1 Tax=Snodgrassella sp. TaxID=2815304 RepID=UPI00258D5E29|nr:dTDP-4-dehydrorhamnose 3,5-epimerase [Snodgrassella sp.]MCO6507717.1 dTDP-4-dehydrorhamnose 3,5-epimerase [Snodgrassella sp.]
MKVRETYIKDLLILRPEIHKDERGWFMESFNQNAFNHILKNFGHKPQNFVQDNHSLSNKGVLRGLHYQKFPYGQGKLIRVIQGKVWDVAVDIRPNSPTFKKWVGIEISGTNQVQFWIPPGFAHGFIALEDNTHLVYKVTEYYKPEFEEIIKWNDSELAIDWPVINQESITLSIKDRNA